MERIARQIDYPEYGTYGSIPQSQIVVCQLNF